jgi:hypothetical protein
MWNSLKYKYEEWMMPIGEIEIGDNEIDITEHL